MGDREHQAQILALCGVKGVNWHVVARGAQQPNGLARLLDGDPIERSADAIDTLALLKDADLQAGVNRAHREIEQAEAAGAKLTTVADDDYPANLRVIYNLPPFLFYRGKLERSDARSVAVVGTRDASKKGLASAARLAENLAEAEVTVLSGLALGIDTAAHEATLAAGGRTVAVLGTGILKTYPAENADLHERIAETGAIVSQFWPTQAPTRYTFPRRNVVTSGMGQGTVVIEATSTSGAKMQARLALEHGKQVFLVESLVTKQEWARKYLDRGAIEVKSVDDVLSRLRSPEQIEQRSMGRRQLTLDAV